MKALPTKNRLRALVGAVSLALSAAAAATPLQSPFERVSTFHVFENSSVSAEAVAEIVAASEDGTTLIYTSSEEDAVGFVDITNPRNPQPAGLVALPGEPTSVAVRGAYALVSVNTSIDFIQTSGELVIIDIATQQIVRSMPLGGQPDAIAVSPDGQYAAIAIENERDEDLGNGEPPQAPAGFLVIVDLIGNNPARWTTRDVSLTGVPDLYPDDPEPEFVAINEFNVVAITMQENNHIALVALATGDVLIDFPAGTVDLIDVDTSEDDLISQTSTLTAVPREPDAITWLTPFTLATADEGDLFGGSRGFTTWQPFGGTLYEAGNTIEHLAASLGHYPEGRSENKGTEPEGVTAADYSDGKYLFVGAERANLVLVYALEPTGPFGAASEPRLVQALPTGVGPEGLLAIPSRDLFVVASEVDDRSDKIRSSLMIYERTGNGNYPSIQSVPAPGEAAPIAWGALSGLSVAPRDDSRLYAVVDSFYKRSSVLVMDRSATPMTLTESLPLVDTNGRLGNALRRIKLAYPGSDDLDISRLINADATVNLDLEGVAVESFSPEFGEVLWVASEGRGNLVGGVSHPSSRPFESPNLLIQLARSPGSEVLDIQRVVALPFELAREQLRFGLEGVTVASDGSVYVVVQRAWEGTGDAADRARIGRFNPATGAWTFALYPLDAPTSPNGGWVGLSDIAEVAPGVLAILERDNQGGPDATIKRIYSVDVTSVTFIAADQGTPATLVKTLESDLFVDGAFAPFGGVIPEKIEGMAILSNGDTLIVNDNDGVDDNSGETRVLTLPSLFK
ncbi:MAG: hypothetical protein ACJA0P_003593 [Planctomycetota bacterium]|jgi:hypothetical protein